MSIYDSLNDMQQKAVYQTEGPLLILAGAGSGKTRVLTHRIAYLMEEKGVNPWNIMAITFTNKAAKEMRERVDQLIGYGSESVWVSTFHSTCVRILRRFIDRLGYDNNFTIYDTDDQKTVMKEVCKRLDVDTKIYKEKNLLGQISKAKNEMISAEEFYANSASDFRQRKVAEVYMEYEKRMRANNALDFDDLLLKTVQLLENDEQVLAYYQDRFLYIMVDEYQDTNTVQFKFVSLLARKNRNLCVVGDDDQSIYKFRGANIRNIWDFEKTYEEAVVIKLEQNYRSTQNILDAANSVIAKNTERKEKRLWTENGKGELIDFHHFDNGYEEAEYVAYDISKKVRKGQRRYKDCAILYRTNAQSRMFEERFIAENIPYKIVGGVNFYGRKEIKDILAYLKTIDNGRDDVAVKRIINVPKRGIGLASLSKVQDYADGRGIGFYDALKEAEEVPGLGRATAKITPFVTMIQKYRSKLGLVSLTDLLDEILEETGYVKELELEDTDEARARIENIDELISKLATYVEQEETPTLGEFLEEVALVADIDSLEEDSDYVVLMTLHSAKGLEFPNVYLAGMEDGLFPSFMTITSDDPMEIEEERRLCYVGITRAMEELHMSSARMRMVRGETQYNKISRFVREIPLDLFQHEIEKEKAKPEEKVGSYQVAKQAFRSKPMVGKQFTVTKAEKLSYVEGDKVNHRMFGIGQVLNITEGGRDYEVTVEFEKVGIKKMFASFAKLEKMS